MQGQWKPRSHGGRPVPAPGSPRACSASLPTSASWSSSAPAPSRRSRPSSTATTAASWPSAGTCSAPSRRPRTPSSTPSWPPIATCSRSSKPIQLRAWLYTIARNRCLSVLRARRERPLEDARRAADRAPLGRGPAPPGPARHAARHRASCPTTSAPRSCSPRSATSRTRRSPRCSSVPREKVKALVFQARSSLIASREARDTPCDEIRAQLSELRGGALRRNDAAPPPQGVRGLPRVPRARCASSAGCWPSRCPWSRRWRSSRACCASALGGGAGAAAAAGGGAAAGGAVAGGRWSPAADGAGREGARRSRRWPAAAPRASRPSRRDSPRPLAGPHPRGRPARRTPRRGTRAGRAGRARRQAAAAGPRRRPDAGRRPASAGTRRDAEHRTSAPARPGRRAAALRPRRRAREQARHAARQPARATAARAEPEPSPARPPTRPTAVAAQGAEAGREGRVAHGAGQEGADRRAGRHADTAVSPPSPEAASRRVDAEPRPTPAPAAEARRSPRRRPHRAAGRAGAAQGCETAGATRPRSATGPELRPAAYRGGGADLRPMRDEDVPAAHELMLAAFERPRAAARRRAAAAPATRARAYPPAPLPHRPIPAAAWVAEDADGRSPARRSRSCARASGASRCSSSDPARQSAASAARCCARALAYGARRARRDHPRLVATRARCAPTRAPASRCIPRPRRSGRPRGVEPAPEVRPFEPGDHAMAAAVDRAVRGAPHGEDLDVARRAGCRAARLPRPRLRRRTAAASVKLLAAPDEEAAAALLRTVLARRPPAHGRGRVAHGRASSGRSTSRVDAGLELRAAAARCSCAATSGPFRPYLPERRVPVTERSACAEQLVAVK